MSQQIKLLDVVRTIRSLFLEVPGLRLRLGRARNVLGVSIPTCRAALGVLVDTGFLSRASDGAYERCRHGLLSREPRRSRDAPWDCSWAEPLLDSAPLWLEGWQTQWTCLRQGGPAVLTARDCVACPRWEPRLVARRHS